MAEFIVKLSVEIAVEADNIADAKTEAWDYWETVCPDLEVEWVTRLVGGDVD